MGSKLGIVGGVSWYSTAEYYRQLNLRVAQLYGAKHSARVVISSLNFADLLNWQKDSSQKELLCAFVEEGRRLKAAGCDAFVIASHTLSWLGERVEEELGIRHICLYSSIFNKLERLGAHSIGLMGTRYTMSDPRYVERYETAGYSVLTPDEPLRNEVARIVYKELVHGQCKGESKETLMACAEHLAQRGAHCVILGCTEMGLHVRRRSVRFPENGRIKLVPMIDLIEAHVDACVSWMQES